MRQETFAICKPNVSHCCGLLFRPIDEYCAVLSCQRCQLLVRNPCSTAFDSAYASAINVLRQTSSDSRRTPTRRMNEHLLSVQRVTRCQCCDTSLLRLEVLNDSIKLILFLTKNWRHKSFRRKIDDTCGSRCSVHYNAIALTQVSNVGIFKRALNF